MPTFEELHAADNAHGKSQLNTLLLEFSATLARLPNLQRELQSWLAQDAQAIDFAALYARAESMLVLAADWLLEYDHLPVEIRQAKAMQDFMRTAGDTVTCRTMTGLVQKFKKSQSEATQKANTVAHVQSLFDGWRRHGLDGKELDITANHWAALTDCKSGLMWAVNCSSLNFPNTTNLTWSEALAWVEKVNQQGWCGYHDWRLPSLVELRTLLLPGYHGYDLNRYSQLFIEFFAKKCCWSSSSHDDNNDRAWYVNFSYGREGAHSKNEHNTDFYVRMVRSSQ